MKKGTKKCLCDEPQCAKCLAVNCEDDNCSVHTPKAKAKYRKMEMTYIQPETPNEDKINKAFDVLFEEVVKQDTKYKK